MCLKDARVLFLYEKGDFKMDRHIEMIKMSIGEKIYDVSDLETYQSNEEAYLRNFTAVVSQDGQYALPIIKAYDGTPGIKIGGLMSREYLPQTEEDKKKYSMDNAINLSDSKNITELLEKQTAIREIEQEILTNPDGNIFTPKITNEDTAAIKALKEAVIEKHINLDNYEMRFGSNFNNDKRLLTKKKISLPMLQRLCNALDIKATLTLEDKEPDVPNPIGKVISVELTDGDDEEDV